VRLGHLIIVYHFFNYWKIENAANNITIWTCTQLKVIYMYGRLYESTLNKFYSDQELSSTLSFKEKIVIPNLQEKEFFYD
jgi:undecaprenyl pyrophosphate phosphatase UppP